MYEELPFFHFSPLDTSIRGKDSQIFLIFHLNILVFQTNGKQPCSFQSSHVSAIAYVLFPVTLLQQFLSAWPSHLAQLFVLFNLAQSLRNSFRSFLVTVPFPFRNFLFAISLMICIF